MAAAAALHAHATPQLKERYLSRLVSGEWIGTMNLTERQSDSDLSAMRTRAEAVAFGRDSEERVISDFITASLIKVDGAMRDASIGSRSPPFMPSGVALTRGSYSGNLYDN